MCYVEDVISASVTVEEDFVSPRKAFDCLKKARFKCNSSKKNFVNTQTTCFRKTIPPLTVVHQNFMLSRNSWIGLRHKKRLVEHLCGILREQLRSRKELCVHSPCNTHEGEDEHNYQIWISKTEKVFQQIKEI